MHTKALIIAEQEDESLDFQHYELPHAKEKFFKRLLQITNANHFYGLQLPLNHQDNK